MPGFYLTNMETCPEIKTDNMMLYRRVEFSNYKMFQHTTLKFPDDKCCELKEEYFSCIEGVILNKKALFAEYGTNDISHLTFLMNQRNTEFFNDFRGSFSGMYWNRGADNWTVFTSHYGDGAVFYYQQEGKFIISSSMEWMAEGLKLNKVNYHVNEKAIYYMLTYGFMADDSTYIQEVSRLLPGHYIKLKETGFQIKPYYILKNGKINLENKSEAEIIEILDELFIRAVKQEYEKDLAYGYSHLVELSGGLDSRMNYWIAHELGYGDSLAVTFCQSNYVDELVAKQIAAYWKEEILVWPMDSAKHLYDVDKCTRLNFGVSLYSGAGSELHIFDSLDMQKYGILHTGQLGGAILGTYIKDEKEVYSLETAGNYSGKLLESYSDNSYSKYENREEYLLNTRGLLGCLGSHLFARHYTEECAPFLDVDVMDFCLSIPLSKRINRYIYKKWILSKHPEAAGFVWERTGDMIDRSEFYLKWKQIKQIAWDVITHPSLLLRKIGFPVKAPILSDYRGMNPMDKWLKDNKDLQMFVGEYYRTHIEIVGKFLSPKLMGDIEELYMQGSMGEKTQIFTALSVIELLFANGNCK